MLPQTVRALPIQTVQPIQTVHAACPHYPYRPYRPYRPPTGRMCPHYPYRPYKPPYRPHARITHTDHTDRTGRPYGLYGQWRYDHLVWSVRSVRVVAVRSTGWSCMGIWGSKATLLLNPANPPCISELSLFGLLLSSQQPVGACACGGFGQPLFPGMIRAAPTLLK